MILKQFLETIKQRIPLNNKQLMIAALVILLIIAALITWVWNHNIRNDTAVMQPAAVNDPAQVGAKLNVSPWVAKDIVQGIQKAVEKPPVMSWTVPTNNVQEAARVVEKQIENKTAPPLPPASKTIVTPRETKVDVYRIDLDSDWEVGVGYGNHEGDSYIPIEIQRNYSKHKAVAVEVHMDMSLKEAKGYELKHIWRF